MGQEQSFYAYQAEAVMTEVAQMLDKMKEVVNVYNTRAYGVGAANAITQADMTAGSNGNMIKGAPDDLYAAVILIGSITTFVDASAYKPSLDKVRLDY